MKKIMKAVTGVIYASVAITLFAYVLTTIQTDRAKISQLEAEKLVLVTERDEDRDKYSETIMDIVKTVQVTDSYLFVGGFNQDESAEFNLKKYEDMLTLKSDLDELLQNTENFFDERKEYMDDLPNIWPLKHSEHIRVTSPWGERYSPITGNIYHHEGMDLVSTAGDRVIATADGIVIDHWLNHPVFGKWLVIKHKDGLVTYYAHLAKAYVTIGEKVVRGEEIGVVGNSGESTGPHLHYAMTRNGQDIDPANYLTPLRDEAAKLTIKE